MRILYTVPFAIVFCLTSAAWGSPQERTFVSKHEIVAPKWYVKLRATIPSEPLGRIVGEGHETRGKPRTSLWFLDNSTIVVTFITREGEPKLSTRESSDASAALRLRAVFFDAESGHVTNTAAWPTVTRFASIVAVQGGKFVTQRGSELTLYSAGLKDLKGLKLPSAGDDEWFAYPSPAGKSLLFITTNLRTHSPVPWIWVNTDSLTVARSWREVQSGWVGISDHYIAMTKCVWFFDCQPEVEVRPVDGNWKTISSADRHNMPHPQFVDDDTVFLLGRPTELLRADGQIVFTDDTPLEGCWWGAVVASSTQRVATPSCKLKGAIPSLDMGGHDVLEKLLVYDAPFRGPSYVLDLKGPVMKDLTTLAISPDGSRLAILNVEKLTLEEIDLPLHSESYDANGDVFSDSLHSYEPLRFLPQAELEIWDGRASGILPIRRHY